MTNVYNDWFVMESLFLVYILWPFFQCFRSKQVIKDAVQGNDFLKNLDSGQIREVVDSMYEKMIQQSHYIIKEGEAGVHLYVSSGMDYILNFHWCILCL